MLQNVSHEVTLLARAVLATYIHSMFRLNLAEHSTMVKEVKVRFHSVAGHTGPEGE
jgi:hypothetical protein